MSKKPTKTAARRPAEVPLIRAAQIFAGEFDAEGRPILPDGAGPGRQRHRRPSKRRIKQLAKELAKIAVDSE